jgi:hypothetical protein
METIVDCNVITEVVFSIFVVSSSQFVTASSKYGGELSSSTLLIVIKLANTRTSDSLL